MTLPSKLPQNPTLIEMRLALQDLQDLYFRQPGRVNASSQIMILLEHILDYLHREA